MRLSKSLLAMVAGVAALGVISAQADEVSFQGTASGAFNGGVPGGTAFLAPGLSYNGADFFGTTASGFLAIGGMGFNFGTFGLTGAAASYNGNTFDLLLTFVLPPGISGGQNATFNANVTGTVSAGLHGGADISFTNSPQSFTFADGNTHGAFELFLNNVDILPGQAEQVLSGHIIASQETRVPDNGTTLSLLGLGLIVVEGLRRKLVSIRA